MSREWLTIDGRRQGYALSQLGRTMTVGELIDFLSRYDDDTLVAINNDDGYTYGTITQSSFRDECDDDDDDDIESSTRIRRGRKSVEASGTSIVPPDEWDDNNYTTDELSDEEIAAIQKRTAKRRAQYEHDRPIWKGRPQVSFGNPDGTAKFSSRGNIAASRRRYSSRNVKASSSKRTYTKYPSC